jgi:TolA-binding protein
LSSTMLGGVLWPTHTADSIGRAVVQATKARVTPPIHRGPAAPRRDADHHRPMSWKLVVLAIVAAALLTGCTSGQSGTHLGARSTTTGSRTSSSSVSTTTSSTSAVTTNPQLASLQLEISQEKTLIEEEKSDLQAAQSKLARDTQLCNNPQEGSPGDQIGLVPCSTQLLVDDGNVSASNSALAQAQSILSTEESTEQQEQSAPGG